MVDVSFFVNVAVLVIATVTLSISIRSFRIQYKPSLVIDRPSVTFTSEKNTRTYSPELMYVDGNYACKERNTIDTMHVKFGIHNESNFTVHNIVAKYVYSNKKITKENFIEQEIEPKFSLVSHRGKTIKKNHKITFDEYDSQPHYFAVLICASHHRSKSEGLIIIRINKNDDQILCEHYK